MLWRKRSREVVWCRDDCIKEANKQKEGKTVYKDIKFKETILSDLMDKSNRILKSFYTCKFITEKEVKYFSYDFKKTSNVDRFYLLPKIHEQLFNVLGRPGISSYGTPKEKASVSWFLFETFNAKWVVIHFRLWRFCLLDEKIRKSPWGILSSNYRCGWSISKHTTQRGILALKSKSEEQTPSRFLLKIWLS